MLGLVLLYIGAVFLINGLTLLGRVSPRESAIMNLFAGAVSFAVSIHVGFAQEGLAQLQFCAYGLMFAFTYFWTAYNNWTGQDGRGLGWFSLFVSITAAAVVFDQLGLAQGLWNYWLVFCWAAWSALWFCNFVLGVYKPAHWIRPVAYATILAAVSTAWLPGYLLLSGHMPD